MVQNHSGEGSAEIVSETSPFSYLPVDCISKIISLTSPRDACVSSLVSKAFKSAVNSDIVWEKFLQLDYESLVLPLQVFSSKKDLYFALSDPFLIQDGKKSFWLEKASGKKCVMLAPRELRISWGNNPQYWQWISIPESRFKEVAELVNVCWFKIHGKIQTRYLSPETRYSAYIVFKKKNQCLGSRDIQVEVGEESFQRFIYFIGSRERRREMKTLDVRKPEEREDGWMETKLCEFFNEACSDDIELSVLEIKSPYLKPGLIIQGIEFRPSKNP